MLHTYNHGELAVKVLKPVVQKISARRDFGQGCCSHRSRALHFLLGMSSLVCLAYLYRFPQYICVISDSLCTIPTLMLVYM